jgi:uncharacterized membrane protein
MKTQETMITSKHRITAIVVVVAIILSIPLVAMQFTNEVNWDLSDFIVMGTLLMATGFGIELVIRNVKTFGSRLLICLGLLFIFFLLWAELAVGIFGSPFAGS